MNNLAAVLIHNQQLKIALERYFIETLSECSPVGLPCYSLPELLEQNNNDEVFKAQFLILKNISRPIAISVNAKVDLIEINAEQVFPLPDLIVQSNRFPFICALAQVKADIVTIMDPRLLS